MTCLKDLTSVVDIKTSSRPAMIGSLTDGSTETFWESGDEDKNKTKSITISCVKGINTSNVSVHVDNSRDIGVRRQQQHRLSNSSFQGELMDDDLQEMAFSVCFLSLFTEQSHISDIPVWKSNGRPLQNQTGGCLWLHDFFDLHKPFK